MRARTWTIGLHPVPLCLYALCLAAVAVPLPVTVAFTVDNGAVAVPVAFTITIPVPIASIVRIAVPPSTAGAGANAESDRTGVRCQAEGTERLATGAGGGPAWDVDGRTTEPEGLTAEGVAGRAGVAHDDISVAVAVAFAGLTLAGFTFAVELLTFPVYEHFAFPVACEVAFAVAAEGGEAEWLWCASALVGVEFCAEETEILFVLLADFAMGCLEVVEGLADDVEFVDLACDWGCGVNSGERRTKGGRTLSLVLVSLAAEVVALVLEGLELVTDVVEGLLEDCEGVGALWGCACGL